MRYSTIISALFAACASANSIKFTNLDSIPKTIYFTPNPNSIGMAPTTLSLPAKGSATWAANGAWEGNYYSVNKGAANVPGMLGEVNFSDPSHVYYDVSAIVDPSDNAGVKQIWAASGDPKSGCTDYSTTCNNAYNLPDDVQTKATSSTRVLYCSVGKATTKTVRSHARDIFTQVKKML